jgi:hypothetical protein
MLRSLEKERYLIKLGSKARSDLQEPFQNLAREFKKVKEDNIDKHGNIGNMEFEEGDIFGRKSFLYNFYRFKQLRITEECSMWRRNGGSSRNNLIR